MDPTRCEPCGQPDMDKDTSREGRLKITKRAEEQLRDELKHHARQQCQEPMAAFAECAKANSLWVVINCRKENRAMNDCLNQYTTEEQFEAYKQKRAKDLTQKST